MNIQLYPSIDQIPQDIWETFASHKSITLEVAHLRAIERSGINHIRPYYLLAMEDEQPVGIAYFFIMRMDLASLASDIPTDVRTTLKAWFPNFLNLCMLECGLLSGLGEAVAARAENFNAFLSSAVQEMERIAQESGADYILIRDIPYAGYARYQALEQHGFAPILGFPSTSLSVSVHSFSEYLALLKSDTRSKIQTHIKKLSASGITVEITADGSADAERLECLWQETNLHASTYEHERLTAAYFRAISHELPDRSLLITLKKGAEILAFSLCFLGEDEFCAMHVGVDYACNEQYSLYFNLTFAALQEAFRRGYQNINLGLTTYDYNASIGCEAQPLVYLVKYIANPQLTGAFAQLLRDSIKQPENIHHPFKQKTLSNQVNLPDLARQFEQPSPRNPRDVFNKAYAYDRTHILKLVDLYAFFPPFESAQAPRIQYQGRPIVMLGNNSYLGLATHPEVKAAAQCAIEKYGTGCSGSPFLNGTLDIHMDLALALADFLGKEDAILFGTGYQANLGVIAAITGRDDVVIMDRLDHASLMDGAWFSHATIARYKHNDMASLETVLCKHVDRPKLVVTDSIFSMEGTLANLPTIVSLCKKYGARLLVDEAHALGVMGPGGRGGAEHFGLLDQVDLVMGTFSKAFAGVGGVVAGEARVIDYLRHVARPHMFSASLPPSVIATVRQALDIIIREPERRQKVLQNAAFMAQGLQALGYDAPYRQTAIVPVYCNNEMLTFGLYKKLFNEGVFVNPIASPAVPQGRELLRTSYMATHDEETLTCALEIFARVRTATFPRCAKK